MSIGKYMMAALLLFSMTVFTGFSEQEIITVQGMDGFTIQDFECLSDSRILVCGSVGETMDYDGAMYIIDLKGESIDITPPEDTLEGMYRDAFMLDEKTMIALRSVPNKDEWRVARLQEGKIIWSTGSIENVFSLDRIGDRFLMYCKPEPVTAEIRCMDFDGNAVWKIRLEERILLEGILVGEETHIAYGSKMEDPIGDNDQRSASLVFDFNNDGEILWRHDGKKLGYSTKFIDGIWSNDGKVILIGYNRVFKYDESGVVWVKEYGGNSMTGIVPVDSGYLISHRNHWKDGMRFIVVDESGELKHEFYLKDVPSKMEMLFEMNGEPYMLSCHRISSGPMQIMKIESDGL